ncbi:hypothetical protein TPHA_0I02860 [Tetrapisispora phaffii CBS 4417]|uniref:Uncharacterized protein n=1 Tax=Tetrapisispora phaffii (strain ATCC 24235 / CBS 4417 / NBRC 1672 / NRRL Y-8282 / UCD 70-5) TaxID=1071381 RepID=G8BY09_TETPH|nr:hypothetical protein TPHA_0I02860 [Tetrapisispora phaffii CBS 4417]CCE64787.1 hypothetical protein TPHA_0I02860 [Tetrapisispora phaffii CBS 4417]
MDSDLDIRQCYAMASLARTKLFNAGRQMYNLKTSRRRDIQLRVVIGHANLLDSVMDKICLYNSSPMPIHYQSATAIDNDDDNVNAPPSVSDTSDDYDDSDESEDSDLDYDELDIFSDEEDNEYVLDSANKIELQLSRSNSESNDLADMRMPSFVMSQNLQLPVFKTIGV